MSIPVPLHAKFDQRTVEKMFALDGFDPTGLIEQERYPLATTGTEWICLVREFQN
jgi:hypothetical protein